MNSNEKKTISFLLFGPGTKSYRFFVEKFSAWRSKLLDTFREWSFGEKLFNKKTDSFQVDCDIERKNFGVWQKSFQQVCRNCTLLVQRNHLKIFFSKKTIFFNFSWFWGKKLLVSGKKVNSAGFSKVQSIYLWVNFEEKFYLWKNFSAFSIDGQWATKHTGMLAKVFDMVVKTSNIPIHRIILRSKFFNGIKFSSSSLHIERNFSGLLSLKKSAK